MADIITAAAVLTGAAVIAPTIYDLIPKNKNTAKEVFVRTGIRYASEEAKGAVGIKLEQAGLKMPAEQFIGLRISLTALGVVIVIPLMLLGINPFWFIILVPLLYFYPGMWLSSKIVTRQSQIRMTLEDFITIFRTALSAGADLYVSLREAGNAVKGPLQDEVDRVLKEANTGSPVAEALMRMADRCNVDELRTISRAIIQSQRYGNALSESIANMADQMRIIRRNETQEAANKLTVKLVFPVLVFMLLPAMGVIFFVAGSALIQVL